MVHQEHSNPANDTTALWAEFRAGDKAALEQIYRQYYPLLYDYGLKLTSEKPLVRDCLQEFFLHLWQRRHRYQEVRNLNAYLMTAFRRSLFSYLEKHRNLAMKQDEYAQFQPDMIFSVEQDLIVGEEEQEQIALVERLLKELSPRQKEVIYLRYFVGLSPADVSDVLGLNYQTIINHFHEAMKTLRKHKPTIIKVLYGCITMISMLLFH